MYEMILIDVDNTLLDFTKAEDMAIRKTLEHFGYQLNEQEIDLYKTINKGLWMQFEQKQITKEALLEKRFSDFFSILKVDCPNPVSINEYYLKQLSNSNDLMPYALETLRGLSLHAKIYAVTNGVYQTQMRRLDGSKIKDYFSEIFVSESIGCSKPESGFFDFVFKKLNNPEKTKVLMVGDSLSADIIGGLNYGIDTCWYNPKGEKTSLKPTYIIGDLRQLLDINII